MKSEHASQAMVLVVTEALGDGCRQVAEKVVAERSCA
jgi:hypothetical protein